jgi:hypothetical protein
MAKRTSKTSQSDAKKRVLFGIAAAATAGALTYGGYRLQRHLKAKKQTLRKEKSLDRALADSMDCSDPISTY